MTVRAALASALVFACMPTALAQLPETRERLVSEDFDSLDWAVWCPCQIKLDGESKLSFLSEDGTGFARIPVGEADIGGNRCLRKTECTPPPSSGIETFSAFTVGGSPADDSDELPERLGPSLVPPAPSAAAGLMEMVTPYPDGGPYCTPERRAAGLKKGEDTDTPCAQRQELRFQDPRMHPSYLPRLYTVRFRMPAEVPDETQSVRWVLAQWKQEPVVQPGPPTPGVEWGPSPFLAQRFDNGLLHVTVQDEECRCLVAAAADASNPPLTETPQRCLSVAPGPEEGKECKADLTAVYDANPLLPSPRGAWVTLAYLVRPGRDGTGYVKVYDGERLVVTVTGSIGYEEIEGVPAFVKFKIGQYNNVLPGEHDMDIDRLTVDSVVVK